MKCRQDEAQAGMKIARRNINHLIYADDTTLMAESKEKVKHFLMKVKEESENVGLKLNIQKTKIMASGPITSWEIDGETVETVTDFIFLGSKITADGDCSHEIKRCLLLGRKAMTNLDSILKSRDITLPTKICLVKAMVFPVVMYGCDSWTIKKAEHQRINAFELWCVRRLLRVPWTASRSNESTLPMRWPKYWSFNFSIIPSKEHSGLISFRMDWLDLLAVQGTLKSLLQHHSSKASILRIYLCIFIFGIKKIHLIIFSNYKLFSHGTAFTSYFKISD